MPGPRPHYPQIPPVALTLLLADADTEDPATGKLSLVGLFSALYAAAAPVRVPRFTVYAEVTAVRGPTPLRVAVALADASGPPVVSADVTVDAADPLKVAVIQARFAGATIFGAAPTSPSCSPARSSWSSGGWLSPRWPTWPGGRRRPLDLTGRRASNMRNRSMRFA